MDLYFAKFLNETKYVPIPLESRDSNPVTSIGSFLTSKSQRQICEFDFPFLTKHKREQTIFNGSFEFNKAKALHPDEQREYLLKVFKTKTNDEDSWLFQTNLDLISKSLKNEYIMSRDNGFVNAIFRISQKLFMNDDNSESVLIDAMESEALECFRNANMCSIIDYMLLNTKQRKRFRVSRAARNISQCTQIIIRAPTLWKHSFCEVKTMFQSGLQKDNLLLSEINTIWLSKFYELDFFENMSFPETPKTFKQKLSVNSGIVSFKIKEQFMADVSCLLCNEKYSNEAKLVKTSSVFISLLLRNLLLRNIEKWLKIIEMSSLYKLPALFEIHPKLTKQCGNKLIKFCFSLLKYAIKVIIKTSRNIPKIETKLGGIIDQNDIESKFNEYVNVNDFEIRSLVSRLKNLFERNDFDELLKYLNRNERKSISLLNKYSDNCELQIENIADYEINFISQIVLKRRFNFIVIDFDRFNDKILLLLKNKRNHLMKTNTERILSKARLLFDLMTQKDMHLNNYSAESLIETLHIMESFANELSSETKYCSDDQDWNFIISRAAHLLDDNELQIVHKYFCCQDSFRIQIKDVESRIRQLIHEKTLFLQNEIESITERYDILKNCAMNFKNAKITLDLKTTSQNLDLLQQIENEYNVILENYILVYDEAKLLVVINIKLLNIEQLGETLENLKLLWEFAFEIGKCFDDCRKQKIQEVDVMSFKLKTETFLARIREKSCELEFDDNIQYLLASVDYLMKVQLAVIEVLKLPFLKKRHHQRIANTLNVENEVDTFSGIESQIDEEKAEEVKQIGNIAEDEHNFDLFLDKMMNDVDGKWSANDYQKIANGILQYENFDKHLQCRIVDSMIEIHSFVEKLAQENDSILIVSPNFIEFVIVFTDIYKMKCKCCYSTKSEFKETIEKLDALICSVNKMIDYKPELHAHCDECDRVMKIIEEEMVKTEIMKEMIAADEAYSIKCANLAEQLYDECYEEMSSAVPALKSAMKAVNIIGEREITFLKTMKNPPFGVKMVVEAVSILLKFNPSTFTANNNYSWCVGRKMLNSCDKKFLKCLREFKINNVSEDTIQLIRCQYLQYPEFDPLLLKNVSTAAAALAQWVKAVDVYHRIVNVVKPKRIKMKEADENVKNMLAKVSKNKCKLEEVNKNYKELNDRFNETLKRKNELLNKINNCESCLVKWKQLLSHLNKLQEEYKQAKIDIDNQLENIIGDMVLASAMITYSSKTSIQEREKFLESWKQILKKYQLNFDANFKLIKALSVCVFDTLNESELEETLLDNALIIKFSKRWPLIIDTFNSLHLHIPEKSNFIEVNELTKEQIEIALNKYSHCSYKVKQKTLFDDKNINEIVKKAFQLALLISQKSSDDRRFYLFPDRKLYLLSPIMQYVPRTFLDKIMVIEWNTNDVMTNNERINTKQLKRLFDLKKLTNYILKCEFNKEDGFVDNLLEYLQ